MIFVHSFFTIYAEKFVNINEILIFPLQNGKIPSKNRVRFSRSRTLAEGLDGHMLGEALSPATAPADSPQWLPYLHNSPKCRFWKKQEVYNG